MDTAETIVRALGAAGLALALAEAGWGAVWGMRRSPGRASGAARRIGALGAYLVSGGPYLAICILLWHPLPLTLAESVRAVALAAGALLGVAGLFFYLWGRFALGDMYNVSSSLGSELYASHRLVTSGPFRFVRHPMYLGIFIGALGALLLYRTWTTVFVIAALPGAVLKARREDRLLAAEFGVAYDAYRRRVPGFVPRIRIGAGARESGADEARRRDAT
jgi:protein-S-isoprenylcysteine O-methyltransferase Ste14